MWESSKGFVKWAAKALVAAVLPLTVAAFNSFVAELAPVFQTWLMSLGGGLGVFFMRNAASR